MKNLPVPVADEDIEEMFEFADKDKNGKLSYKEFEVYYNLPSFLKRSSYWNFQIMVKPQCPPEMPKPHISDLGMEPQMFSPPTPQEAPSNFASPLLPDRSSRSSFCSSTTTSRKRLSKTGSSKSSDSGSKTDRLWLKKNIHIVQVLYQIFFFE